MGGQGTLRRAEGLDGLVALFVILAQHGAQLTPASVHGSALFEVMAVARVLGMSNSALHL